MFKSERSIGCWCSAREVSRQIGRSPDAKKSWTFRRTWAESNERISGRIYIYIYIRAGISVTYRQISRPRTGETSCEPRVRRRVEVSGISWRNEQPPTVVRSRPLSRALQHSIVRISVNRFPVHQLDNLHERRSSRYFGVEVVALKVIPWMMADPLRAFYPKCKSS